MISPPSRLRVVGLRVLAGLLPVLAVGLAWLATIWAVRVPQGEIVQITTAPGFEGLPSLSPDGTLLAYRSDAAGNGDILLRRIDGRDPINLTLASPDDESDPAFSPDGREIAFASARAGLSIVSRDGGPIRHLTREGMAPAWSPDGRVLFYAVTRGAGDDARVAVSEGWRLDLTSGANFRLSNGDFHQPAVSPHNRRVAYWGRPMDRAGRRPMGARGQIWTARLDGSDPRRLTGEVAVESSPLWSPDGRYLYYVSNRSGPMAIWRARVDERTGRLRGRPVIVPTPYSQPVRITRSADGGRFAWSDATPVQRAMRVAFDEDARRTRGVPRAVASGDVLWENAEPSPDGSTLLLAGSRKRLHLAGADGRDARPLTGDDFLEERPRWSPDGRWIAFQSNRVSGHSTWLVASDGRGLRELPRASGDLLFPVWSPDGERLAVWDTALAAGRIMRMEAEAPTTETLPPTVQGGFVPSDWSPDGTLIAGTAGGSVWVYAVAARSYVPFRPGGSPVWLNDSRRLLYAHNGRLYIADSVLQISREFLAVPDQQLDLPRLSHDNRELFFTESGTDANLWLMTVGAGLHGMRAFDFPWPGSRER